MKTVVIIGSAPLPDELRDIMERGSTSFVEQSVAEASDAPAIDADRLVFWSATAEPAVRSIAERYAAEERAKRGETVMFVSGDAGAAAAGGQFSAEELFVWPRDEDRLRMAFLTGA